MKAFSAAEAARVAFSPKNHSLMLLLVTLRTFDREVVTKFKKNWVGDDGVVVLI